METASVFGYSNTTLFGFALANNNRLSLRHFNKHLIARVPLNDSQRYQLLKPNESTLKCSFDANPLSSSQTRKKKPLLHPLKCSRMNTVSPESKGNVSITLNPLFLISRMFWPWFVILFMGVLSGPGSKDQKWVHEGLITESLPNGMFRVRVDSGDVILGYVSGKIRKSFIRILPGDRVKIEVSRYDSSKGRITYRLRSKDTNA